MPERFDGTAHEQAIDILIGDGHAPNLKVTTNIEVSSNGRMVRLSYRTTNGTELEAFVHLISREVWIIPSNVLRAKYIG